MRSLTSSEIYDFDLDGDQDLIVLDNRDGKIYWFENVDGSFEMAVELVNADYIDFKCADLNSDGNIDIVGVKPTVVFGDEGSGVSWFENAGDDSFLPEAMLLDGYITGSRIEIVDVDNYGELDLIIGGNETDRDGDEIITRNGLIWIKNLGDGVFDDPIDISRNVKGFKDMSISDLDNDGDFDIVAACQFPSKITWFKNAFNATRQVSGILYYDENENGIRDIDEVGFGGIQVESDPLGSFSYTFDTGEYRINFEDVADGTYSVFPEELEHWTITSDPAEYDIIVDGGFEAAIDKDFGFFPTDDDTELRGALVGGFPRCNRITNYWISYENIGGVLSSGVIAFELDEELDYYSASVEPDSIVGNFHYWSYEDLMFFDDQTITLSAEIPGFELMGDTIKSYMKVIALNDLGAELFVFEDSVSQVVVCAYDPNIKTVSPAGSGDFGNIPPSTEFLDYTIHFQNTGTDTAFTVVIKDQLHENLVWSSLQINGKSHPAEVSIDPYGEVTFAFNDIMLPDSNVNEIASHGFVQYRIDLIPDLEIGAVITNTANIYFDANPAIVTNTTINTIYVDEPSDLGLSDENQKTVLVYPNPFNNNTTVYFSNGLNDNKTVRVFDVMGKEVFVRSNVAGNQLVINAEDLGKGIYILTVEDNQTNKRVHTDKLIVQ